MYVTVLSNHRVSFEDVKEKIHRMGFEVVGQDFEFLKEVPRNIVLYMLFGFRELYPTMPIQGFVKVVTPITHPKGKSYVRIYDTPWYLKIYYQILFSVMFLNALRKK